MNNLTYREKFTCEMVWGSIPMTKNWEKIDTDYIRGSQLFNDGLKRFDNGEWRSLEKEIWKDVVGFEGFYKISNHGNLQSVARVVIVIRNGQKYNYSIKGKFIKLSPAKSTGYAKVSLCKNGIIKDVYVHSLVMHSFVSPQSKLHYINHIDGDKMNNHISNLEYVTPAQNNQHAIDMKLYTHSKGVDWCRAKLTEKDIEYIRCNFIGRNMGKGRGNRCVLAKKFNVTPGTINNLIKGHTYKL